MRRILFPLLVIGLAAGLFTLGSGAFFSDTETSTGNVFTAGTLDLTYQLDGGAVINGTNASFTESNKKPGDSGVHTFTLKNAGSIAATTGLTVTVALTADNENTCEEPEVAIEGVGCTAGGELDTNITVTLFVDNGAGGGTPCNGVRDGTETILFGPAALSGIGGPYTVSAPLASLASVCLSETWSIPGATTNVIQSDSITENFTFDLNQ